MIKASRTYFLLLMVMTGFVALCDLSLVIGTWQENDVSFRAQIERFGASWGSLAVLGGVGTLVVLALAGPLAWLLRRRGISLMSLVAPVLAGLSALVALVSAQCWFAMALPHVLDTVWWVLTGGASLAAFLWVAMRGMPERVLVLNQRLSLALTVPGLVGLVAICSTLADQPVAPAGLAGGPVPKYVFVLSVDSLSAKHMSLYGYSRDTTPNLAQFAEQATVFDRMYASSNWTVSGIASLISGVRPWTHRGLNMSSGPLQAPFDTGLFSMTKALGYTNSAYVTNFNASPQTHGGNQWFDRIRYPLAETMTFGLSTPWRVYDRQPRVGGTELLIYEWADALLAKLGIVSSTDNRSPAITFDAMLTDLKEDQSRAGAYLYWAHFYPPHYPYAAPAPFLGKFDTSPLGRTRFESTPKTTNQANSAAQDPLFPVVYANRYDESVAYMDAEFGRFFEALKQRGIFNESLIIITADHGESFSHGCATHGGACLHEEVVSIPLLIKQPGQVAPQRIKEPMEQADLLPTLGAMLGLVPDDQSLWEGVSVLPAMKGGTAAHPVLMMNLQESARRSALPTGSVAVVDGPWKFIHRFGYRPGMYPVSLEDALYNLDEDPDEARNVASDHPEVAGRLMALVFKNLKAHAEVRYAR